MDRHMQVIVELHVVGSAKLAIRSRINDFPVKLLRRNLELKVAVWRVTFHLGPCRYAHEGKHDQDSCRNNRPDDLQGRISMSISGTLPFSLAVHDEKHNHQHGDNNEGYRGDIINKIKQRVDL